MYYFVYKTTNLINGKYYIGKHQTENINDGYLGSGTAFKKAVKEYGKENFKREIISFCNTAEDMDNLEREIVNDSVVNDKNSYNLTTGGEGGSFFKGKHHSEEVKRLIAQKNWATTEEGRERLRKYALARSDEFSKRSKEFWRKLTQNERRNEVLRRRAKSLREKDIKKFGCVLLSTEEKISEMFLRGNELMNKPQKLVNKNGKREITNITKIKISRKIKSSWDKRYLNEAYEIEEFFKKTFLVQ